MFRRQQIATRMDNSPKYNAIEIPDVSPRNFTAEQRRADLFRRVLNAGSPHAINQSREAERYDVHRSTVCRDMNELGEYVGENIGNDARLTARAVFEQTLSDLQNADDWRASKAAFDTMMDWQSWLQDTGEQEREPDKLAVQTETDTVRVSFGDEDE